jgi:hypothetical protein
MDIGIHMQIEIAAAGRLARALWRARRLFMVRRR